MTSRLEWVVEGGGTELRVKIRGSVDEFSEFAPLLSELADKTHVRLDLSDIERINSCGVREWVNFMRAIPAQLNVQLERCSPPMVSQINMIANFVGTARVASVEAPFVCGACGHEEDVLLSVEAGTVPSVTEQRCSKCGDATELDDFEESYFGFLTRRSGNGRRA